MIRERNQVGRRGGDRLGPGVCANGSRCGMPPCSRRTRQAGIAQWAGPLYMTEGNRGGIANCCNAWASYSASSPAGDTAGLSNTSRHGLYRMVPGWPQMGAAERWLPRGRASQANMNHGPDAVGRLGGRLGWAHTDVPPVF